MTTTTQNVSPAALPTGLRMVNPNGGSGLCFAQAQELLEIQLEHIELLLDHVKRIVPDLVAGSHGEDPWRAAWSAA